MRNTIIIGVLLAVLVLSGAFVVYGHGPYGQGWYGGYGRHHGPGWHHGQGWHNGPGWWGGSGMMGPGMMGWWHDWWGRGDRSRMPYRVTPPGQPSSNR